MGAAEKMGLGDSWLRGESPKAIGRAFGKPSSVFIASWPPVLRRPVETTSNSGQTRVWLDCPLSADIVAKVSNRGATIFPPEDKTGRDRRLIWPQAYYRSRR